MKPLWLNPSSFPVTRDYVSLNQIMVGCGCCPFPECETPRIEIESKDGVLCALTVNRAFNPEDAWCGTPGLTFDAPADQAVEESVAYRSFTVSAHITRYVDGIGEEVSEFDITIAKIPRTYFPNGESFDPDQPCSVWVTDGTYTKHYTAYWSPGVLQQEDFYTSTITNGVAVGTYTSTSYDTDGTTVLSTGGGTWNAIPEGPLSGNYSNYAQDIATGDPLEATLATTLTGSTAELAVTYADNALDHVTVTFDPAYLDETAGPDIGTGLTPVAFQPSYDGNVTTGQTILAYLDTTYVDTNDKDTDPRIESAEGGYSRYRMKIPATWRAIKDARDAWEALTPEEQALEDEPPPLARTVWEMEWDETLFPQEWLDWLARKTAHEEWEVAHAAFPALHAAWVTAGSIPPEPTDPVEPPVAGAEPAQPSLHQSRSWTWDGETHESDWFTVAMPEEHGEVRLTNVGTICYHSTRTGILPCLSSEHRRYTTP